MRPRVKQLPRLALLLLVVAVPLLSATTLLRARGAAAHASAAAVVTGPMTMITSVPGVALTSSVANVDGTYTLTWDASAAGGTEVQATGPAGTTVSLSLTTTNTGEITGALDVTPPAVDKTLAMFQAAQGTLVQPLQVAHACATLSVAGGIATEYYCDLQTLRINNGGGDWYLSDEMEATTTLKKNPFYALYSSYVGDSYHSGNTMVQWQPNRTYNEGNCTNTTLGFSYQGVSISRTFTFCPTRVDPGINALGGPGIEEFWHGPVSGIINGVSIGMSPIDLMHSPPAASAAFTVHAYIHLT